MQDEFAHEYWTLEIEAVDGKANWKRQFNTAPLDQLSVRNVVISVRVSLALVAIALA
jgi:hypothetical protein